MKKTTEGVQQ